MTAIGPVHPGIFRMSEGGPELTGSRCRSCGKIFFPAMAVCPGCRAKEMETAPLGRTGKLFSYTTVHIPAQNFRPPYAVGYVAVPEGLLVFAPLRVESDRPLAVGMSMRLELLELPGSSPVSEEGAARTAAFCYAPA